MLKKIVYAAFAMMSFFAVVNVHAASANPPMKGGVCWANIGLSATVASNTNLVCETIGNLTVAQLYEKGFRVATIAHNPKNPEFVTIIIEEQR